MTRCADFWKKWRKEPNFCGLSPQAISEIKGYLELVEKLTRSGIQEETIFEMCPSGACRPLLRLSDDETKTEGINYLIRHLKDGEKVTAKNLKATINAVLKKDATCEVRSTHLRTEKSPITADSPKGTLPIKPDSSTTPAAPEIQNAPTAQDPHALSALIAGTVPPEPAAHNPPPCKGGGGCPHGKFKPRVSKDAIKGNMCDAIGIEIAQLPGNVCPYDVKLEKMARQLPEERPGFHTASNRPSFQGIPKASSDPGRTLTITFSPEEWDILKDIQRYVDEVDGFDPAVHFSVKKMGEQMGGA